MPENTLSGPSAPLLDRRLRDQNPWWVNPAAIAGDPHIARLRSSPFVSNPAVLETMPLTPGDVNTLRGPRQTGKTTTAKRLIQRLLAQGETRILYYAFDVETDNAAIPEVIRRGKTLARRTPGPWFIFLDEVTAIPDWQRGVKYAWDVGMIHEDFVLCTGSSAHRMGAEQLPGRRGGGRNYIQLGLSFREFCAAVGLDSLPRETASVLDMASGRCRDLLQHLYLMEEQLDGALLDYQRVGGFPAAVADHLRVREVSTNTVLAVWS